MFSHLWFHSFLLFHPSLRTWFNFITMMMMDKEIYLLMVKRKHKSKINWVS